MLPNWRRHGILRLLQKGVHHGMARSRIPRVLLRAAERGAFAYIHLLSAASFLSGLAFLATTNTITAGWPFAVLTLFVVTSAVLTIPIAVVEIVRIRGRGGKSDATEAANGSEGVQAEAVKDAPEESVKSAPPLP